MRFADFCICRIIFRFRNSCKWVKNLTIVKKNYFPACKIPKRWYIKEDLKNWGRLAQLVRASRLHRECLGFESLNAHHFWPQNGNNRCRFLPYTLPIPETWVILSQISHSGANYGKTKNELRSQAQFTRQQRAAITISAIKSKVSVNASA